MRKIRGGRQVAPLMGTLLVVGMLAITGLAAFNVFLSEFLIISAAFATHQYLAAGLLLLLLTAVFASVIAHPIHMVFGRGGNAPGARSASQSGVDQHQSERQRSGWAEKTALGLLLLPALVLL